MILEGVHIFFFSSEKTKKTNKTSFSGEVQCFKIRIYIKINFSFSCFLSSIFSKMKEYWNQFGGEEFFRKDDDDDNDDEMENINNRFGSGSDDDGDDNNFDRNFRPFGNRDDDDVCHF